MAARLEAQLLDLLDAIWISGLRSIEAIRPHEQRLELEVLSWRIRSPANKGGDRVMPLHYDLGRYFGAAASRQRQG